MVDIILHVGRPKTGTTAIQNFLAKNHSNLLEQGILYPHTGRFSLDSNNHLAFFLSLSSPKTFVLPFSHDRTLSGSVYTQLLQSEIEAYGANTVILSCEALFLPEFDADDLTAIKHYLNFGNVSVLAILRDQAAVLDSSRAQLVTGLQRFSGNAKQHFEVQHARGIFDYESRLATFERIFGLDRVNAVWYESRQLDLLEPLCHLAGIDRSRQFYPIYSDNVRKSWFEVSVTRHCNHLSLRPRQRAFILRTLRRTEKLFKLLGIQYIVDKGFQPYTHKTKAELRQRYETSNARVTERYCMRSTPLHGPE